MSAQLLTPAQIGDFIRSHRWKFARTMPDNPHWYVVRSRCRCEVEFERMVRTIQETGFIERYGKRDYTCIDVQTDVIVFKYWTMGEPPHKTVIINRAVRRLIISDGVRRDIARVCDLAPPRSNAR